MVNNAITKNTSYPHKPLSGRLFRTQIYILSRNRVDYCRATIRSALVQQASDFEVIVSDNSDNDGVQEMVTTEFPSVSFIRRWPVLPALDHFHAVMQSVSAEEVVFFHDDDLLEPNYLQEMRSALDANPDAAAVGCDAWIMRGDRMTQTRFMMSFEKTTQVPTAEVLLAPYLCFSTHRAAPFPGYMYRARHVNGLCLDAGEGGKHADVTFLLKVVRRAPIVWLARPLMHYRMHGSNDSAVENVGQRLSLLRYIYTHTAITPKSSSVGEFRFRYWIRWWLSYGKSASKTQPWRRAVVKKFLVLQSIKYFVSKPSIWLRIATGAR